PLHLVPLAVRSKAADLRLRFLWRQPLLNASSFPPPPLANRKRRGMFQKAFECAFKPSEVVYTLRP
ncbi:MAG: hypothetical protein ACTS5F_00935, partial [Candidatus Hodgkinia cicadicola]